MSPSGRLPLSDAAKNERLVIRVTSNERAMLDAGAKCAGKSTSTWARDLLLEAAHAALKKPAKKK